MRMIIPFLAFCLVATCNAELRTWTAVNGKEVEAEFVSNEKGIVKLKLKSSKVFEVPLNKLSKADQDFLKAKSSSGSLADTIVGKLITVKPDDGYTMQILLNEDGVMVVAGLRDQRLTYKIEGNEVLIFKEEERDGGISFSSSSPKVGDQVEMGAKEEKMRGKITKIEAADEFIRFSAKPEGVNGEEELEEREDIAYLKGSDTPYTGKVFELDGNGNKQREGFYKDGRREGIMIVWYYNGQKMREGNFKDGELDGLFIRWHMNGEKRAEGSFKDGKLVEGSEKRWDKKGEPVDSEEEAEDNKFISSLAKSEGVNGDELEALGGNGDTYLKGSDTPYTGKYFRLYKNGQKMSEGNYKDGKPDGLHVGWHENGQKGGEANYKDGKQHGLCLFWHENGQKRSEGSFKDGEEVEGSAKYWNSKGEPVDSEEEAFAE